VKEKPAKEKAAKKDTTAEKSEETGEVKRGRGRPKKAAA